MEDIKAYHTATFCDLAETVASQRARIVYWRVLQVQEEQAQWGQGWPTSQLLDMFDGSLKAGNRQGGWRGPGGV